MQVDSVPTLHLRLAVSSLLALFAGNASATSTTIWERVADKCVSAFLSDAVPGAQVSVVVDRQLVFQKGYGVTSTSLGRPTDANTLFRAGSTQKMMTAAALLTQKDEGRLQLDDSLARWVPELRLAGAWRTNQITLHHLLDHSSGLPNSDSTENCVTDDNTLSARAAALSGTKLFSRPGAIWNYSNDGYSLAGLVAERAAHMPYTSLIRDRVWHRAGMMQTMLRVEDAMAYGNVSHGHVGNASGQIVSLPPDAYQCGWSFPAGDAFTTAGDMARWSIMLMSDGGNTLSPSSAQAILSPSLDTYLPSGDKYGFGTFITDIGGTQFVHHGGRTPGWAASLLLIPADGFSVSTLTNGEGGAGEISQCLIKETLNVSWPDSGSSETPPASWRKYAGIYSVTYDSGEQSVGFVYLDGQRLRLTTYDPSRRQWLKLEAKQVHLDSFFIDLDGDGELSADHELITFIQKRATEGPGMWLRSLAFVGNRTY
ncbi:MAG: beta-lactamase family protein [Rhodanobacteraceae bacterium]|nr:beta-lactamase family protein [Rhodanobacteraceae bacterium]